MYFASGIEWDMYGHWATQIWQQVSAESSPLLRALWKDPRLIYSTRGVLFTPNVPWMHLQFLENCCPHLEANSLQGFFSSLIERKKRVLRYTILQYGYFACSFVERARSYRFWYDINIHKWCMSQTLAFVWRRLVTLRKVSELIEEKIVPYRIASGWIEGNPMRDLKQKKQGEIIISFF